MSDTMKLQCELDHKTQEVAEQAEQITTLIKNNNIYQGKIMFQAEQIREAERLRDIAIGLKPKKEWDKIAEQDKELLEQVKQITALKEFAKKYCNDRLILENQRLKEEISGCILRMDDGDFPKRGHGVTELEQKLDECIINNDQYQKQLVEQIATLKKDADIRLCDDGFNAGEMESLQAENKRLKELVKRIGQYANNTDYNYVQCEIDKALKGERDVTQKIL